MNRRFVIKYEVDTGWDYVRDIALIEAESAEQAVEYLKKFIRKTRGDNGVSRIFEVKEFKGYIFTGNYGFGTIERNDKYEENN